MRLFLLSLIKRITTNAIRATNVILNLLSSLPVRIFLYLASLLIIWAWLSSSFWTLRYFWDWSGDVATVLVIVGVIGETFAEWTEEHARKYRSLAKLSVAVLIVGLAIELSAHRIATDLTAEETADADKQLGQTFKAAGSAIERASEADERAGLADQNAGKANERAGKNEREAAVLRKQAARIVKRAEDEATARIAIEQRLEWRSLSMPQAEAIRKARPQELIWLNVGMEYIAGDLEGGLYADAIRSALNVAGLKAADPVANLLSGPLPVGVQIRTGDAFRVNERVLRSLQRTLRAAEIYAPVLRYKDMGVLDIVIFVGLKPLPTDMPVAK